MTRDVVVRLVLYLMLLSCLCLGNSAVRASDTAVDPHSVPSVDAGIGSCSVEFTVKDATGAPVYDSKVHVHFSYGMLGAHKMDLEVGSNIDGKVRFDGLPSRVKLGLNFHAVQGDREGSVFIDPAENCKAKHDIVLAKKP